MTTDRQLVDVLSEFAGTMVTDFPIQRILNQLVERIVDILPISAAGVTLISPGVDPHYIAASNDSALRFEKLQTELGDGPCLAAFYTGEAVSVPDLRIEARFPHFVPSALDAGLLAVFTFPLRHGDRRLGALDLYRDAPGPLSPSAQAAAQTLADVASAYLLNAQARADLQDSSDKSREAALHDALTGLPNRVLILERIEHAFLRDRRSGRISAVLFVDLDRFKAVNDAYGHRAGDALLLAVADRLTALLRSGDTLARISGDEFVILCEDLDTPAHADGIAHRVDAALASPFLISGVDVSITASIGAAFAGQRHDTAEQVIHNADLAMYRAKHRRRGGSQVLDLREEHLAQHQAGLSRDLEGVVGRGELHLDYQPIVNAADGRLSGVEALLRWSHPNRGLVSPSVLIPVAEQTGQINEIGGWVLKQAWADRNAWQRRRPDTLAVSVNVSAHQLMSVGFAQSVEDVLGAGEADHPLLTLEVTESVFVRDSNRALVVLNDLKDMGVTLALDDFGTGYSSLGYLKRFPVDIVKIDRSFVADLERDPASRTIVAAVIALAHGFGMSVVAEGVETTQQHRQLNALGCDACQGYYFARPMPAATLDAIIRLGTDGAGPQLPVGSSAFRRSAGQPADQL